MVAENYKKVLENVKLNKSDIDNIIFARGGSLIPKLRKIIERFFGGKKFYYHLNYYNCPTKKPKKEKEKEKKDNTYS